MAFYTENFSPDTVLDNKVKYDAGDPTAGYLGAKVVAGTGITLSEGTGADENKLKITNSLDLSSYVPYSGATTNVNLGAYNLTATSVIETTPTLLKLDQTTPQTIANGQPIQDTLTASQIVATDVNKKLQTLAVATYPSLTELSYVKGVTSAIQTQLNGKLATGLALLLDQTTPQSVINGKPNFKAGLIADDTGTFNFTAITGTPSHVGVHKTTANGLGATAITAVIENDITNLNNDEYLYGFGYGVLIDGDGQYRGPSSAYGVLGFVNLADGGYADSVVGSGNNLNIYGGSYVGYAVGTDATISINQADTHVAVVVGNSIKIQSSNTATIEDATGINIQISKTVGSTLLATTGINIGDMLVGPTYYAIKTGSGKVQFGDDVYILSDNKKLYFGAAQDAILTFTGTQFQIQSNVVTASDSLLLRGGTNGVLFNVGASQYLGITAATSLFANMVTLRTGSATAGTAPLKFTSGALLATPEAGAIEFLTDKYYATITTGAVRKEIALRDTYYGGMYSYENANVTTIEEANVYHAVSASGIVAGSNSGFTWTAGVQGAIASVADYSGTVAGTILITVTAGHNLTSNDYITIHGTTNYNGKYKVTVVSPTTFYVTKAYVSSQTGTYARGARLVANTESAGTYRVSYNISGFTAGNNKNIKLELVKNLTDLDNTASIVKYNSGTDYQNQHGEGMVTITDGDHIYMTVNNKTDGTNYTFYMTNMNIIRI